MSETVNGCVNTVMTICMFHGKKHLKERMKNERIRKADKGTGRVESPEE